MKECDLGKAKSLNLAYKFEEREREREREREEATLLLWEVLQVKKKKKVLREEMDGFLQQQQGLRKWVETETVGKC